MTDPSLDEVRSINSIHAQERIAHARAEEHAARMEYDRLALRFDAPPDRRFLSTDPLGDGRVWGCPRGCCSTSI